MLKNRVYVRTVCLYVLPLCFGNSVCFTALAAFYEINKTRYRHVAARRYASRRWQFDFRRIRSPAVAKLQAASVPIDYGSCALEQTDGRVAVSLNAAPYGGGIKIQ